MIFFTRDYGKQKRCHLKPRDHALLGSSADQMRTQIRL